MPRSTIATAAPATRTCTPTSPISVKVRREDGSWSAMDSQTVHHHIVALSERYNTRLEDGLRQRLGVTFSDRAGTGRDGKRSIREIDGVPVELIGAMSSRRRQVEDNIAALTRQFEADQHRVPSRREQEGIAQQAVCMGRPRKDQVRSLGAMRAEWHEQAVEVLGAGPGRRARGRYPRPARPDADPRRRQRRPCRPDRDRHASRRARAPGPGLT